MTSLLFQDVLKISTYYENYNKKFDNLVKSIDVTSPNELYETIYKIVKDIQLFKNSFNRKNIIFKKFINSKTYF